MILQQKPPAYLSAYRSLCHHCNAPCIYSKAAQDASTTVAKLSPAEMDNLWEQAKRDEIGGTIALYFARRELQSTLIPSFFVTTYHYLHVCPVRGYLFVVIVFQGIQAP